MKAIRVEKAGPPEVMKLQEVPDPTPGTGEIVVKVHAIGVNPVDTYFRSGNYPNASFPYTPGMDAAGVVESVGSGVQKVKPGQRVYVARSISGTYAEKVLCQEKQVWPLADSLTFEQGAAIFVPYATAWRALFQKAKAKAGQSVLIHGASGGVGTAAVQIAKAAGLRVFGTGGTDRGRQLVSQNGADVVLDHTDSGYIEKALEQTGGRGFDVILEMLANVNLEHDLKMITFGGTIVVIGNRGRIEIDPRMIMGKEPLVTGMVLMSASDEELAAVHAGLHEGFQSGQLKPVIGKQFPLQEAPEAHVAVMAPGAYGKIILVP